MLHRCSERNDNQRLVHLRVKQERYAPSCYYLSDATKYCDDQGHQLQQLQHEPAFFISKREHKVLGMERRLYRATRLTNRLLPQGMQLAFSSPV